MKLFDTEQEESRRTRLWRFRYNCLPPIRGTGSWLTFLSSDWHEAHLKLSLNLVTRNYVGTIFGGAMFSATDPMYMVMLIKILGPDYIVWDKAANIRFLQPGKGRLRGQFTVSPATIASIKETVASQQQVDKIFTFTWVNEAGRPVARIEKTVYIADKAFYQAKKERRK